MKITRHLLAAAMILFATGSFAEEIAVLLPLTGPLTPLEKSELTREAVKGLSEQFELKHGGEVDQFVRQAFQEESQKQDCDETNCYRRIAARYHADKIAAIRIVQIAQGSYLVTSHLYDVPTGELTVSEQSKCTQCSIQKLKVLCKALTGKMKPGH